MEGSESLLLMGNRPVSPVKEVVSKPPVTAHELHTLYQEEREHYIEGLARWTWNQLLVFNMKTTVERVVDGKPAFSRSFWPGFDDANKNMNIMKAVMIVMKRDHPELILHIEEPGVEDHPVLRCTIVGAV
jgi:hypothetical protein